MPIGSFFTKIPKLKEEKTMSIRRFSIDSAITGIFIIGIWLLGSVPQAMAETLNYKYFAHVTKREAISIPDAEGHIVTLSVREGAVILENSEMGWFRTITIADMTKGAGNYQMYRTVTFQDGSAFTSRSKGSIEAAPSGVMGASKSTGEIFHGTGRFQGIKGTETTSSKLLPPEKGELAGKSLGEGTFVYTLPSK